MQRIFYGIVILLAGTLFTGCEEDVVAVLNAEYPYSMYGVLNPLSDIQYVRVFKVEGTLLPQGDGPLGARFVSVDLDTGEERVWRDSLIAISDGSIGHVYYSPFRVEWEHSYRITITSPEGRASFAEVKVPPRTNLILDLPDTTASVLLPASIQGVVPQLFRSELEIQVRYVIGFDPAGNPFYEFLTYTIPYDEEVRRSGDRWSILVNMDEVYAEVAGEVMRDLRYQASNGISLQLISFSAVIGNEEWAPPGGVFDPNILIQPGAFSNVQNGFGLIAAGYRLKRSWTLPYEVVLLTGFVPSI